MVLLKETRSKFGTSWLVVAFGLLALFLVASAASATPCDIKNSAPPFICHDLIYSFCELYFYGYSTIIVTNPYRGGDMTDMAVIENLGSFGLTFTSAQVLGFSLLGSRQDSNQSNTINVLAANKVGPPGGSPCVLASNDIFDLIGTGDLAASTSNCQWGDTYDQYASTSVYLGGKIWT